MRLLHAAADAAVRLVAATIVFIIIAAPAFAQSSAPDASTVVSIHIADLLNPIIETLGVILGAAVTFFVARVVSFLPGWARVLFTAAIQAQVANFIRQGISWAIQKAEGFDQDKTVSFDVGSAGVAEALRYVLEHAPSYLVNLAGGKDAIVQKIIAFLTEHGIVLDANVSPEQVAATAAKSA